MNAIPRGGDWMQTYSGRQFWPMDPRAEEIDIRDIAHALSNQCRYAGHCISFYSVAEHCVHMARYVSAPNKLWALLHDASEAYLVDIPRPVKPYLSGYMGAEKYLMAAVAERFGLTQIMPAEVKETDNRILLDERRQNMVPTDDSWGFDHLEPLGIKLQFWEPTRARREFLDTFKTLTHISEAA